MKKDDWWGDLLKFLGFLWLLDFFTGDEPEHFEECHEKHDDEA